MLPTPFMSLPVLDDDQIQSILLAYSMEFDRWPKSLLPSCVTDRITAEAEDTLLRIRERGPVDPQDELVHRDQLEFCNTEKPILRTAWGYLMGERAPRWHDGTLLMMNMIGISCFAAMPPALERGMQEAMTESLDKIVRSYAGVAVITGSEGELCRLACTCVWEDESDTDLSPCTQMVNIVYELFEQHRLQNLIHHAAAEVSNGGRVMTAPNVYASPYRHFH